MDSVVIKIEVDDSELKKLKSDINKIPEGLEQSDPFKKMNEGIKQEIGLLEALRQKEKQLLSDREKSTDIKQIRKYNAELAQTQAQINKLQGGTTALGSAFKGAFAALGALGVIAGLAETIKYVVQTTATFEKFKAVLTNTLGSQRAAAEAFDLIQKTAATTPFSLEQVTEAYIKLANRGLKPTELALKSFADIAASQGKELDQFVEAALDATQGEFERLKEFGIKASKSGEQITFAFKGIKESVENTPEAINAFLVALGQVEGVAGSTDSISQTLSGTWSNLGDNAGQLANALGTILLPVINGLLKGVNYLVSGFTWLINSVTEFGKDAYAVATGMEGVRKVTKDFEADTLAVNDAVKQESDSLNKLYKNLINTTAGTEGRKKAIEELQSKYGKTIDLTNLENASLGQIAKSQAKANNEILNAVKIKEKQAVIDKMQSQLKQGYYKDDADAQALIRKNIESLQAEIKDLQTVEVQTTQLTKEQIKQREKAYKDYIEGIKNLQEQLQALRNENNLNKIVDENARKRTEIAQKEYDELAKLEKEAIKNGTQNTQEYAQSRLAIQDKYKLEQEKLTKDIAERQRQSEMTAQQQLSAQYESNLVAELALTDEYAAKELEIAQRKNNELLKLQEDFQKNGLINTELYAQNVAAVEKKYELELNKFRAENDKKRGKAAENVQKDLFESAKVGADKGIELEKTTEQKKLEIQKTAIAVTQEISNAAFEILAMQRQAQLESQLNNINTEFTAQQTAIQKEIELRQSQGKSTQDLEAKLAASKEAQRKKEAQIKTEAAKKDKAAAIIKAIIDTALAIAAANTLIPPANIPAMILAGVAGAAQIALIAAQPIPKFAKGTLSVKGGVAGKDSVPALLMPGESVLPVATTRAYAPAIEAIYKGKVSPSLANELLTGKKSGVNKVSESNITINNSIDSEGLNTFVESNGSKTKVLNKRYLRKV